MYSNNKETPVRELRYALDHLSRIAPDAYELEAPAVAKRFGLRRKALDGLVWDWQWALTFIEGWSRGELSPRVLRPQWAATLARVITLMEG